MNSEWIRHCNPCRKITLVFVFLPFTRIGSALFHQMPLAECVAHLVKCADGPNTYRWLAQMIIITADWTDVNASPTTIIFMLSSMVFLKNAPLFSVVIYTWSLKVQHKTAVSKWVSVCCCWAWWRQRWLTTTNELCSCLLSGTLRMLASAPSTHSTCIFNDTPITRWA